MIPVDARGLACPMPIWMLAKAARAAAAGETLRLVATDPAVRPDVTAWCEATGNLLVRFEEEQGSPCLTYVAVVQLRQSQDSG